MGLHIGCRLADILIAGGVGNVDPQIGSRFIGHVDQQFIRHPRPFAAPTRLIGAVNIARPVHVAGKVGFLPVMGTQNAEIVNAVHPVGVESFPCLYQVGILQTV